MNPHYYNEIDPYCCKVLRARIADGSLPYGYVDERDIRDVAPADLAGFTQCHFFAGIGGFPLGIKWAGAERLRLWTGGFPCQDISMAGDRAGISGERSGLWSEFYRLIRAIRPEILIVENVTALLVPIDGNTPAPIARVLGDLSEIGFCAEWHGVPASAVGAPHERDRVWIVAHPEHRWIPQRRRVEVVGEEGGQRNGVPRHDASGGREQTATVLPDTFGERLQGFLQARAASRPVDGGVAGSRQTEPGVGGSVYGIPFELDGIPTTTNDRANRNARIHALGNAVVPQVVEAIARAILERGAA